MTVHPEAIKLTFLGTAMSLSMVVDRILHNRRIKNLWGTNELNDTRSQRISEDFLNKSRIDHSEDRLFIPEERQEELVPRDQEFLRVICTLERVKIPNELNNVQRSPAPDADDTVLRSVLIGAGEDDGEERKEAERPRRGGAGRGLAGRA